MIEELYISDVDYVLSIQYLEQYEKYNNYDLLNKSETLSLEVIDIRKKYLNNEKENLRLTCVGPYCNLAYVEILRNNHNKALDYIQKAWGEHSKEKTPLMYYYLYYVQSKYEKSKNNLESAIESLNIAVDYVKKYLSTSYMLYIKRSFELGKLYEENKNYQKAYSVYSELYEILNKINFLNFDIYYEVEKSLEKLHVKK